LKAIHAHGNFGNANVWLLWGLLSVAVAAYFIAGMLSDSAATHPLLTPARRMLLPGKSTDGHYQIELACSACHRDPFGGAEAMQAACVDCHGESLTRADDSHPTSKFLDPRNAMLREKLDAASCVACHTEHRPQITAAMAVTIPPDVCAHCHSDIAQERPGHAGLEFTTCASSGCHNFHDNQALYEDFLLKRNGGEATVAHARLPRRNFAEVASVLPDYPAAEHPIRPLARTDVDAPTLAARNDVVDDWLTSKHSQSGVNCSACHAANAVWSDRPGYGVCAACHSLETQGFTSGKHGMRLAHGLRPMTPRGARLPMKADAMDVELNCTSCHGAHAFDSASAAVEACVGCHDDEHTRAYMTSTHYVLWRRERAGKADAGSGVSCATCHLPRIEHRDAEFDLERVLVQHNQSESLRPNEKMVRSVCLACHGLQFSLDALADRKLIGRNFAGRPAVHVRSIEMAQRRAAEHEAQRRAADQTTQH
jgi:hypothetical protein